MKALITGTAGFIGSHLMDKLIADGHQVYGYDAHTEAASAWDYVHDKLVQMYEADVCSLSQFTSILRKIQPDIVFHLAAQSHVDASLDFPIETMRVNAVGTQVVASVCGSEGIPMLYCSTDEVHGDIIGTKWQRSGADEIETPINPSSPYSAGKAAGEMVVRAAARSFGLKAVITRGCNAFGPRQTAEKLIPIACRALQRPDYKVPLHGGGGQLRQWVHVREFADVLAAAGYLLRDDRFAPEVPTFNIAGPQILSVADIVNMIGREVGRDDVFCYSTGDRPGQDKAYHLNGRTTASVLGIKPKIRLTDCIRDLIGDYPADGELKIADYPDEDELMRQQLKRLGYT